MMIAQSAQLGTAGAAAGAGGITISGAGAGAGDGGKTISGG